MPGMPGGGCGFLVSFVRVFICLTTTPEVGQGGRPAFVWDPAPVHGKKRGGEKHKKRKKGPGVEQVTVEGAANEELSEPIGLFDEAA